MKHTTALMVLFALSCSPAPEVPPPPPPTTPFTSSAVSSSITSSSPEDSADLTLAERESQVQRDAAALEPHLNTFWTRELAARYQVPFDPPEYVSFYRGSGNRTCGTSRLAQPNNAYYCFVDASEHVAYDLTWLAEYLRTEPGGATTFLVLAHEWGHAVQDSWLEAGGRDVWVPSLRQELNADCLAGVFLASAIRDRTVIEEAGDAEAIWGWLFANGGGTWLNPADHGTSEQRQVAFSEGYLRGTDHCRVKY